MTGYSAQTIAGGTGFMNHVVRLHLRYDDDSLDLPRTIIVKLPSTDPGLRMLSANWGWIVARSGSIRKSQPMATYRSRIRTTVGSIQQTGAPSCCWRM